MPSVSNIAIGANMAAAAAQKARHGMNESIARLSTGVRAMYGGDAAGLLNGYNKPRRLDRVLHKPLVTLKMVCLTCNKVNLFF